MVRLGGNTIIFEGPDMCGKTHIGKHVARALGFSYFKFSDESGSFQRDGGGTQYFADLTRYAGVFMADFVAQTRPNVIIDRSYPSERVYSEHFGRGCDDAIHRRIDQLYAQGGTFIVVCRRKTYDNVYDDLRPDLIHPESLAKLDGLYQKFTDWTMCQTMTLWVDDEDLERQTSDVVCEYLKFKHGVGASDAV